MMLTKVVRIVYGLPGVLYVLIGAGSIVLPLGWLALGLLRTERRPSAHGHLTTH